MSNFVDPTVVLDLVAEPDSPHQGVDSEQVGLPDATSEPTEAAGRRGELYILCELCNAIVYDNEAHLQSEHCDVKQLLAYTSARPSPNSKAAKGPQKLDVAHMLGTFVYESVRGADQGAALYGVIDRASKQLRQLLHEALDSRPDVYLFGSCVTMGIWDGMGDADFAVIFPRLMKADRAEMNRKEGAFDQSDREAEGECQDGEEEDGAGAEPDPETGAAAAAGEPDLPQAPQVISADTAATTTPSPTPPPLPALLSDRRRKELESQCVLNIARKLRGGGFKFEELEVLPRTRVPLVKRRREAKRPYELRHLGEAYRIDIHFRDSFQAKNFNPGHYGVREVAGRASRGRKGVSTTVELDDGAAALRFFSRREAPGIDKQWTMYHRLPELFSVDFDISCRPFGIRNSWFLRAYFVQDPVFRAGNLFIKQWSKQRGVNFSRQGYLTSYAISCLWIYFLLCAGEATFVDPAETPFEPTAAQEAIEYMPLWPFAADAPQHNTQLKRLGKLVRDFFHFYAREFDYTTTVVTLRRDVRDASQRMTREARGWVETQGEDSVLLRNRIYTHFCIEDVYEELNLGRHLSPLKVAWVRAQFADGLECCDRGEFSNLLLNPFEEAEESLHAALFRHLVEHGPSTIAALHAHLTSQPRSAAYLATYELRHRLSDLWFDCAIQDSDVSTGVFHRRRLDNWEPPVNPVTKGMWAAVCTSDSEPAAAKSSRQATRPRRVDEFPEAFLTRVVHLVSPALAVVSSDLPDVMARYRAVAAQLATAKGRTVGVALPLHEMHCPLLMHLFFSLDCGARVFDSFAAKKAFAEQLRLVAICLASVEGARGEGQQPPSSHTPNNSGKCNAPVGAIVKKPEKKKRGPGRSQQNNESAQQIDSLGAAITAEISTRKLGLAQEPLIRYILSCQSYISQTAEGVKATSQLERHAGKVGTEEAVRRTRLS